MALTKEQFRTIALKMIDELCDLPDCIWSGTTPVSRSTFVFRNGDRITVVVGLDQPDELEKGGAL